MFELSHEQAAIVHHQDGSAIVRAGAGTGKTETLTQRVLQLLIEGVNEGPCELDEVVVLTFTEKAAAEMRQRIYQGILERYVAETDPHQRQRLRTLRAGFADRNRIGTFDSFNRMLLTTYPERSILPIGFEPMTAHDERVLHQQLIRTFWDHLDEGQAEIRHAFFDLLNLFERRRALYLVSGMAEEETSILRKYAELPTRSAFEKELLSLIDVARNRIMLRYEKAMRRYWQYYIATLPQGLPVELETVLLDREQLRFHDCEWLTQQTKFRKAKIKDVWKELCAELEESALPFLRPWRELDKKRNEALSAFEIGGNESWANVDWESRNIVSRLAQCALWWKEQRTAICRANRWASFAEIQHAAGQLLEDIVVREQLRQGSQYILIDEFQDTNMEQWRFIDRFRRDNVLIIGDEKQAIYRFRGGDITVFDEVRRQLGGRATYELSISRRSIPSIVNFCNRLFAEVLPSEEEHEDFEAPFQALQAADESIEDEGVWLLRGKSNMDEEKSSTAIDRAHVADAVALFLRELQDDAAIPGDKLRHPNFRTVSDRIRAGESGVIGVLFRTHERKALFEQALQLHGVRYTSVQGIGFFQSEQVRDALNLLRFFFDAHDSIAMVGVLRSPLIGLSDQAIMELSVYDPEQPFWLTVQKLLGEAALESIIHRDEDRHALRLGIPRLKRWRKLARLNPMSSVLETIWRESELAFSFALSPDADQQAENWAKAIEIVRDRESKGMGNTRELADYFTAQEQAEDREADAALPDGGAIQLMTVYAAKGLGFPMVILAQTDDVAPVDRETLKRGAFPSRDDIRYCVKMIDEDEGTAPILWNILREEDRAQRDAEFRRLLYVACTRAKERLVITAPNSYRGGSWAELMSPFYIGLPIVISASGETSTTSIPDQFSVQPLDLSALINA